MKNISKKRLLSPNAKVIIEGRNVILRPISEEQVNDRYLSWLNDPESNKFLETRHKKQSIEDVVEYVNSLRRKKDCEVFAIFTKKKGIHIGNIAITAYNAHNQGVAIYGIVTGDAKARILGLGGEASALMVEYIFSDPAIRKIREGASSDNYASWKTLESLGFKREGILRKNIVLSSGKINDSYIYGMLCEEWIDSRKRLANILNGMKVTSVKG